MSPAGTIVLALVLVPALLVASYPLQISRLFARSARRRRLLEPRGTPPPISVLVPCRGAEERLAANAEAILAQEFAAPAEILFCVESASDPALQVLWPLLKRSPGSAARVVVTGVAGEDLGKMHNLIGGLEAATGRRLILLDSDVHLDDPGYLERFARALDQPGIGLVTCFPAYGGCRSVAAAVTAMMINHDLLGLFATLAAGGSLRLANGSCLAIDRAVLEDAGGLGAVRRQLLMDTALARNVRRVGYGVWLHEEGAPVTAGAMTWRQLRQQSRRWQLAMWRVLPRWQYLAWAWLRSGVVLGFLAALFSGLRPEFVAAAGASLGIRFLVAWRVDRRYLRTGAFPAMAWLVPLVEAVACWEALSAPWGRSVEWRGRRYRVGARGCALASTEAELERSRP